MSGDPGLFGGGSWCDCDPAETKSRDPDTVLAHDLTCLYGGEKKRRPNRKRCTCWVPKVMATGAIGLNEHDEECGFPKRRCENDQHHVWIHRACGKPLRMRYCGCTGSDHGFTYDRARGWWVHCECGWPTKAWCDRLGNPAPRELEGVKPITYHEYRMVPKNPKRPFEALSDRQKQMSEQAIGTWVWD